MTYEDFDRKIESAIQRFRKIDKSEPVRLISHLDADGICSSAIMINALNREGNKYIHSTVKQLTDKVLKELSRENYNTYIFTDLGSGQYDLVKQYLGEKTIFILDHHEFDTEILKVIPENIVIINPHSYGLDGSNEISGAGVVYLFAEKLNKQNEDTAHIALIGAIGDVQENNGFHGLNKKIFDVAIRKENLKVEKGIRWFGIEAKSLYKLLVYSKDPLIPGITGNESAVVEFLDSLSILPKKDDEWTTYNDLTEDEKKKLISAMIVKRSSLESPEDIFQDRYILAKEENGVFRDAREFSTMLNACGRMDKPSYGIGSCLRDEESRKKALEIASEYRREIVSSLRWYDTAKESGDVTIKEGYIIINARDTVRATMIGTLASIISNSDDIKKGTIIISLARDDENVTKVSIRIVGETEDVDLREIINEITTNSGGESGGHKNAAGAVIKTTEEDKFITTAHDVLARYTQEKLSVL